MAEVLLIDDETIKERTGLHTNIDPKLIYPEILVTQDMYIQPILGTNLFNKIKDLVSSNEIILDINLEYKNLLDDYIVRALVYYTLSSLPQALSYQLYNKGVLRKNDDNATQPSMGEIIDVANGYRQRAEFYGKRLLLHLQANANKFTEYYTYNTALDSINPIGDNYESPIWLDDDENCGYNGVPYWQYKP